jgi:hypothetical protein
MLYQLGFNVYLICAVGVVGPQFGADFLRLGADFRRRGAHNKLHIYMYTYIIH